MLVLSIVILAFLFVLSPETTYSAAALAIQGLAILAASLLAMAVFIGIPVIISNL